MKWYRPWGKLLGGIWFGRMYITPNIQISRNVLPNNLDTRECNYLYVWLS